MSINLLGSDLEKTSISARFLIKQRDFTKRKTPTAKALFFEFQGEKHNFTCKKRVRPLG